MQKKLFRSRLVLLLAALLVPGLPAPAGAGIWERLQQLRIADSAAAEVVTYTPPEWPVPLNADLYLPPAVISQELHPVVLLLHGGAWQRGDKSSEKTLGRALAGHGYAALAVNYRLAPQARHPAQLQDVQQALRWLQEHAEEYRLDVGRVAAWGYAAGGHLAALLAVQPPSDLPPLRVVIVGGAPVDLRDPALDQATLRAFLGGTRRQIPAVYERASPMAQLRPGLPAFLLYHGSVDEVVPPAMAQRFANALAAADVAVELVWLEGLDHDGAAASDKVQPLALDYLDHHLGQTVPEGLPMPGDTPTGFIRMSAPLRRGSAAAALF